MVKLTRKWLYFSLFYSLFVYLGCNQESAVAPVEEEDYDLGTVISVEEIATYTPEQIDFLNTMYDIQTDLTFLYNVQCLQMIYQTEDINGIHIRASGALFIPSAAHSLPLLSINHGTQTERTLVASIDPLLTPEGVASLWTASLGYLTCAPDYPGFGVSTTLHPYIHAKSLSIAIIDMLRATRNYASENDINLNSQTFLTGYSEGGYATLAAQKEIEANYASEFQLSAVAPMAGPYDLIYIMDKLLNSYSYSNPAYIGFFFTAYNKIYCWNRLSDIFKSPYAAMMPTLYDGTHSFSEINNQLPTTLSLLFNNQFISDYLQGKETEIRSAIQENTLLDWTPQAPIRFFHGDADDVSPYQNALNTLSSLSAEGGSTIELVTIPGGTHATSGIPCILGMVEWFEQIKE